MSIHHTKIKQHIASIMASNFQDLSSPASVWNYKDFDSYLKQLIEKDGISLTFNATTFRVKIVLPAQARLDSTMILTSGSHIGTKVPNLSEATDVLNIHCDFISESLVDGQDTDIIYNFRISVLQPSYSFTLQPRRITFNPINKTTISSIRMWVTDGKRRLLDLDLIDFQKCRII